MAVETQVLAGHSSSGELVRSIDWKGAFWVASGVPALVLFFNWRHRRYDWKTRISGRGPSVEDNSRWQRRRRRHEHNFQPAFDEVACYGAGSTGLHTCRHRTRRPRRRRPAGDYRPDAVLRSDASQNASTYRAQMIFLVCGTGWKQCFQPFFLRVSLLRNIERLRKSTHARKKMKVEQSR